MSLNFVAERARPRGFFGENRRPFVAGLAGGNINHYIVRVLGRESHTRPRLIDINFPLSGIAGLKNNFVYPGADRRAYVYA